MAQVDISKVTTLCSLLEELLLGKEGPNLQMVLWRHNFVHMLKQLRFGDKLTNYSSLTLTLLLVKSASFSLIFLCLLRQEPKHMKSLLCPTFIFCYLWAIGGNINCTYWENFDNFIKKQFEENRNAKVETHTHATKAEINYAQNFWHKLQNKWKA